MCVSLLLGLASRLLAPALFYKCAWPCECVNQWFTVMRRSGKRSRVCSERNYVSVQRRGRLKRVWPRSRRGATQRQKEERKNICKRGASRALACCIRLTCKSLLHGNRLNPFFVIICKHGAGPFHSSLIFASVRDNTYHSLATAPNTPHRPP